MKEMSQAEYAKHRGVSRVAVHKWKEKGLLVLTKSGTISVNRTDKKLNALEKSETEEIGGLLPPENEPEQAKDCLSHDSGKSDVVRQVEAEKEEIPKLPKKLKALLGDQMMSKNEAETMKENYLAKLRKLEYEKKAGRVVEVEPLKKVLFELWRRERDALLNFPTRYSAVIAAKLGINQNVLTIELERCINEFLTERADKPRITIGENV
jgi:hypothetical protein